MRIIFLDFDGVIVTPKMKYHTADPFCISELNRIVRATGARIVVTSTWRFRGKRKIKELFSEWGVEAKLAGFTDDLSRRNESGIFSSVERGVEIQDWLDDEESPKVESFVILDDDDDMADLKSQLVQTSPQIGLTPKDANAAIAKLIS